MNQKKKLRGLFRTTYNQLLVYVNVSLQYILPKEKQLTVKNAVTVTPEPGTAR